MNNTNSQNELDHKDRLDRATSARLAKLASRRVDTLRLEESVERALSENSAPESARLPLVWKHWWRPIATAAAILVAVTIGWFALDGSVTPVIAAPSELAQIHYDVANGLTPHITASSVAEVNRLLAAQSNGGLLVPELPGEIKSCCLYKYAATTVTCALIERDGKRITVAIADGAMLHSPDGKTVTRDGRSFIVHTVNGINMVMAHGSGRWLCVMGEVTMEELVEVAAGITL